MTSYGMRHPIRHWPNMIRQCLCCPVRACALFFARVNLQSLFPLLVFSPQTNRAPSQALGPLGDGMPSFIVAKPATLQALISHFETARAQYLANLKDAHDRLPSTNNSFHQTGAAGLGKLPRDGDRQYDSSEDEDEDKGPRGGMFDGGAEDDGQVAEDIPSKPGQWFLVNLDRFTASKGGQQKGGVDGAMLSTLDLGGGRSNL